MLPYQITRRVINETNITEVVSEYVKLKKKGSSMVGLCPFHNDNRPSMSVSEKVKMFNCFSCGTKGNVITFVSKIENITIDQATIKLAKRLGIEVDEKKSAQAIKEERLIKVMDSANTFYKFYLKNSDEGVNAINYLHDRGITDEIIEESEIGLAPSNKDFLYLALSKQNHNVLDAINLGLIKEDSQDSYYDTFRTRIMFPISNRYGKVVGFSGRIYTPSNQAKYINSIESDIFHKSDILYNYYNAIQYIRKVDCVYIFEGFMDVIASKKAGILNCVATMGTAMTNEHINMLLSLTKNIVLCFDGDTAGINAMKRSASLLARYNNMPKSVVLPFGLDPDEFLNKYSANELVNYLETKQKNVYYWLYDLAYNKLNKTDLASIENFKNEVFEFLHLANDETIQSFFLKKLSSDLDVSIDKLSIAFNSTLSTQEKFNVKKVNKEVERKETYIVKKREAKITQKVIIAYNSIIKHSFFSKDRFAKFFEACSDEGVIRYPGKELVNQYLILVELQNFYSENDYLGIENLHLIFKNNTELLKLSLEIVNDCLIDHTTKSNFDECLKAIIDFDHQQSKIRAYNDAIANSKSNDFLEKFDEYMKLKDNTVKIIKKNNNF